MDIGNYYVVLPACFITRDSIENVWLHWKNLFFAWIQYRRGRPCPTSLYLSIKISSQTESKRAKDIMLEIGQQGHNKNNQINRNMSENV